LKWRWTLAIVLGLAAIALLLLLARAQIAAQLTRSYFRQHGIAASVQIGALGLSGMSGRFALGPRDAPEISADRIELHFDPLRWMPYVVEVRLAAPVVRAQVDADGKVRLGSLQSWIDSLGKQQGKSRFVSDDVAVSLSGLRLLLTTPAGPLEVFGDARLVKNLPVSLSLHARPADITYQQTRVMLRTAALTFDQATATLNLAFSGAVKNATLDAQGLDARLDATGFQWRSTNGQLSATASSVGLRAAASSVTAGQTMATPKLDITARDVALSSGGGIEARADLAVSADGGFDAAQLPLPAADPALVRAVRRNLARLSVAFAGHAERRGGMTRFSLTQPLQVRGDGGAMLRVPTLAVSGKDDSLNAALEGGFSGPGLPTARFATGNLVWSGGGFTANAALSARFNYAMLHGAVVDAHGVLSWQSGRYGFALTRCAKATLAAFHPAASDMAKNIQASVCASGRPLLSSEGAHWKLDAMARAASAFLPLANSQLDQAAGHLSFEGEGGDFHGVVAVSAARMSDRTPSPRFKPLLSSGSVALSGGVWRGKFTASDVAKTPLGDITFEHKMADGTGTAHIAAPHLTFRPNHLQPENLSPLLVAFRRAEGTAGFEGDLSWTGDVINSHGTLSIESLDFLTPMGKAHAVKSKMEFISLLPPQTAENQQVTISRIDWTLPFTGVDLHFAFSPTSVKVQALSSGWAEGNAATGGMTIDLANPGNISGAIQLSSIALGSLVTASNLGSKLKVQGKISGTVPFSKGPDGVRITGGHIAADGPGRLSVDRSLWVQGDAAISSNAVQDFAYQALENLAFDSMSADLNSVANGRLQVVFHIKGRSDPPKRQVAEVAIADIINGTALYKPIALPSGTPIDLTLDTSLNFDELLKFYAEAWSKSLHPPDTAPGAKP
jgi:Dicarboxylate transport